MFKTRLLSGIMLIVIAILTIHANGWILTGTLAVISCIGFMELSRAAGIHTPEKKLNALEFTAIAGTAAYYVCLKCSIPDPFTLMVLILVFMAMMFVYVFTYPAYTALQVMPAFFSFIYAPVMLSFIYMTRNLEHGKYLVWMIFLSAWGSDTCAYCAGMLWGKHKMSPKLSPKKSVEGAVGGVIGAAVLCGLFGFILQDVMKVNGLVWLLAGIGAAGALISMVGDLSASAVKRNFGIKDYGKLIPGHGGIMDRFDSIIFTAPVIYFLSLILI